MLVGRRLFKGETDLDTFKQVQAAVIPDVQKLRSEVTSDLANVLNKALARNRDDRYRAAGDFARDLAVVLDRLGRPVTYQDIARLVTEAAGERSSKRKAEHKDTAGMVGDLILDALHDFSGGNAEQAASALESRGLHAPVSGDFVNPSEWGLDALFDEAPSALSPPAQSTPRVVSVAPVPPGAKAVAGGRASPPPHPPSAAPPEPPAPAAERARHAVPAPTEGGPWWRRWFGS